MKGSWDTGATIRRFLAAIFLLGAVGTGVELFLLEHTKDLWQWLPLVLLTAGIVLLLFQAPSTLRIFQLMMFLFLLSGFIGIGLHYKAKVEFKLEMNPALDGWDLILETMKGSSLPPILAPGMMIQMGLLGFAYTYRHPALLKKKS